MSSSQHNSLPQDLSDLIMMEAPDSPPEMNPSSAGPLFSSSQAPNSSQPMSQHASSSRPTNGDSAAKINHGAPGSSWSSKKFQEEYERAYSSLLDQDWDHTKYGDPLLK